MVLQTVGGATVTAPVVTVSAATTQVMITVSETVDPSELLALFFFAQADPCKFKGTSTQIATRTVVAGTTTFTSVIGGGETATITRTIFNTVTGAANRVRARRLGNEGVFGDGCMPLALKEADYGSLDSRTDFCGQQKLRLGFLHFASLPYSLFLIWADSVNALSLSFDFPRDPPSALIIILGWSLCHLSHFLVVLRSRERRVTVRRREGSKSEES